MPDAPRKKRWLRRAIIGPALLLALVAVGFALMRSDPGWYGRARVDPARVELDERAVRDRLATLHNAVGRSQVEARRAGATTFPAFEFRISESELNGLLAKWAEPAGGAGGAEPEWTQPQVRIADGRVELAARSKSVGSLISIAMTAETGADGTPVVTLGRPWAGRLPLSMSLVRSGPLLDSLREEESLPKDFVDALAKLLAGEPVSPPVVPISSSYDAPKLLPARVEAISLKDGELVAQLRPYLPSATTAPAAK